MPRGQALSTGLFVSKTTGAFTPENQQSRLSELPRRAAVLFAERLEERCVIGKARRQRGRDDRFTLADGRRRLDEPLLQHILVQRAARVPLEGVHQVGRAEEKLARQPVH